MASMSITEALRLARKSLADQHGLTFAVIDGKTRAIPAGRNSFGVANDKATQEAADAYNAIDDHASKMFTERR